MQARLTAAVSGLRSIVTIDKTREQIIAMQERALTVADKITAKYGTVDANNQTIDANQQRNVVLYEGIIRDDKAKIGKLEDKFEACQSRQKWIALLSFGGGLYVGNRVGSGQSLNPFSSFQQASSQGYPLSFYEQTNTEKRLRALLKQK